MLTSHQFRQLLYNLRVALEGVLEENGRWTHNNPDSYPTAELPREYLHAEKWRDHPREPVRSPYDNPRYKSYLLAYLATGDGNSFPALGIPLETDRYIHPDKGVMKVHLEHGHVVLADDCFYLTDAGRTYLHGLEQDSVNAPRYGAA